jgi:hypothetical protein
MTDIEWKCSGCGILSPNKVRSCDCPTNVVFSGNLHEWKVDDPSDLVERLRTRHVFGSLEIEQQRQDAADLIESLRAKLREAEEKVGKLTEYGEGMRAEVKRLSDECQDALAQVEQARDAIALADKMLSEHIEEFHDFDYQPHEVPPELAGLRAIEHHLMGSLILDEDISTLSSTEGGTELPRPER